jgi:DNA-binding IclR family transcriptional regulator
MNDTGELERRVDDSNQATKETREQLNGSPAGGRYAIAVLGKALDLIDALDNGDALTLTQLSQRVGVPKPTSLRILANLEDRGYVERDSHGQYRLGIRLLQLGARKSEAMDLRTVARPFMKELHAEFDETVNLAVPGEGGIVYIDILQSTRGLRMAATVGMRDDYHSSALGKAMMSSWPDTKIERELGAGPFERKTAKTVRTREEFVDKLGDVRLRGYALDDEENEMGARCVGAPIFDHRGTCIGAVSVSGSASRLTDERVESLGRRVRQAAASISKTLGYHKAEVQTTVVPRLKSPRGYPA